MVVQGVDITAAQGAAGLAVMTGSFKASDVVAAVIAAGVPNADFLPERVADRLLQQERRAKRIMFGGTRWTKMR